MPLNDLNQELYDPNSKDIVNRTHEQSDYTPVVNKADQASPFDPNEQWKQPQKGMSPTQKRNVWIAVSLFFAVVFLVGGAMFYSWWMKNAFHQDRVVVSFEGPKEADSIQNVKYIIHYQNNNRVTLKNAEIQLSYSENFQPVDNLNLKFLSTSASKIFLGDIKPMTVGQIELKGVFYAPKDSPVFIKGELHFVPSNGTSELVMDDQIGVNITSAPVVMNVSAPQQVVDGDTLEYAIDYKNLDTKNLPNVQVRIDFPDGFQMVSSLPRPSEKDSYWYVGGLDANQGGKINIQGKMNGNTNDAKNTIISLGSLDQDGNFIVYNKQEINMRLVAPVLAITQKISDKIDNIVKPGELLKYVISYQNKSEIGMRDSIITVDINSSILDFSKITVDNKGFYDAAKGTITWKAADLPSLAIIAPGTGGNVSFTVPIKAIIPVVGKTDKNFVISSLAKIDSPDIPTPINSNKIIGSNKLELKLASKVLFDTTGFFNDSKIKNSGAMPMVVGSETTFTMHWQVTNISNDISKVNVTSALPSGVRWTGQIYPANEKITYNERTNQIVWDAGDILAGTGLLTPPREVAFQVGITPEINQAGSSVVLLTKSIFTAKDLFAGQDVILASDQKTTNLPEDPSVGYANGKVLK